MNDVRVRGTENPAEVAAVLAVLRRRLRADETSAPYGIAAWAIGRRAALTRNPRHHEARTG